MASDQVIGSLVGVGLGPGDPELLTLKAAKAIRCARVIAYPAPDVGDSFARSIASQFIPEDAVELPIIIPMLAQHFPANEVYDQAQRKIEKHLDQGTDVIVLCQGDPLFYGSFMYLLIRVSKAYPVKVIPGVTSLTACAAAATLPLCGRTESLTVLTGTSEDSLLEPRLSQGGAFVIVKVGVHLSRLRRVLQRVGMADTAVYVSHASLPHQRVLPLADAPVDAPYFSTILVPGGNVIRGG